MNIIVELVSPGRFFKDAPIHSLNERLKKRGFEVVFASIRRTLFASSKTMPVLPVW